MCLRHLFSPSGVSRFRRYLYRNFLKFSFTPICSDSNLYISSQNLHLVQRVVSSASIWSSPHLPPYNLLDGQHHLPAPLCCLSRWEVRQLNDYHADDVMPTIFLHEGFAQLYTSSGLSTWICWPSAWFIFATLPRSWFTFVVGNKCCHGGWHCNALGGILDIISKNCTFRSTATSRVSSQAFLHWQ